jgi:MscS family membrane protein
MAAATLPTTAEAAAAASVLPASRPVDIFADTQGDVLVQVKQAFEHTGLTQTIFQTGAGGWLMFAVSVFVGLALGRIIAVALSRAGRNAAERVRLIRAVLINSFVGPITLLLFLVGFAFGTTFLTLSPPLRQFLVSLIQLLNLIWIGWLLYNSVDLVTIALGRWSRGRQGNLSVMLVPLARKTLRVVLVTVLLLFAAENIFGQDVKTLLAGLGIAGLAVSLAAQDTIRNLFGSIMIFADQPFAIGDTVKLMDYEGKVEDIGFRSTRLRTADGYVATIPNGNIASSAVLNFSRRQGIRRTLDITLAPDATREQMAEALRLLRETVADADLASGFDEDHPASVTFDDPAQRRARLTYWFKGKDPAAYAVHAERLNLELIERFHRAGIAFK